MQGKLLSLASSGATRNALTKDMIGNLKIPLPPLPTQRAIAHILGALDDKIELLRRMNETLEAMARALFKSWFVDFDPVRKKAAGEPTGLPPEIDSLFPASFVESELGEIPEGWSVGMLGDYLTILDSKRVPLSSRERATRKGHYPYYGATSIMDYIDDYLFDGINILMGEDGSVVRDDGTPFVQYVWGKIWVNNHAHVLQGRGISNEHLYLFLSQLNVVPYVTGAVQAKINQENMKRIPFISASAEINMSFAEVISGYYSIYRGFCDQQKTLISLRDSLLPKLISGELEIKEIDKILEPAR